MYPQTTLKLARRASDQNVILTYVCQVNEIKPNDHLEADTHHKPTHYTNPRTEFKVDSDDDHIRVERSKALHELVESHRKSNENVKASSNETSSTITCPTTSGVESEKSENDEAFLSGNPNVLKFTKMKWLTEDHEDGPDSSVPSASSSSSTFSSQYSMESDRHPVQHMSLSDKYLSTILRLDREHNMFGLSNIAIVGARASKKIRKDDDKAVFHQEAIVQICCASQCCKFRSKTDLPPSLKCGSCYSCCVSPSCLNCMSSCGRSCGSPCTFVCPPVADGLCQDCCPSAKKGCSAARYGLKIMVKEKQKKEPVEVTLTPRSSCILQKPLACRSCHHIPRCVPPSACFPYLMQCYWPSRSAAPCNHPEQCFHKPRCQPPRPAERIPWIPGQYNTKKHKRYKLMMRYLVQFVQHFFRFA